MKKNDSFHLSLFILFVVQQIIFLGTLILIFCINNYYIIIGVAILFVIINAYAFKNKIYKPALEIDKVIEYLDLENNYNSFFDKNNGLLDKIRNILTNIKEFTERERSAEILRRKAEISALQSQINPHFLYNTLDAIRGQALNLDVTEISDMIEALSRYFRYNISNKGDFVTLEDEIDNVKNYIYIQQYRFTDKFSFMVKHDEVDSEVFSFLIPKLTIQPLIENAIYHGLEPKIENGEITIRLCTTEKRLIIIVSDDGVGMNNETLEKFIYQLRHNYTKKQNENVDRHSGIALLNVNQRLKLLFGEEYGLSICSTLNLGTEVEISLPIIKGEHELSRLRGDNNKK